MDNFILNWLFYADNFDFSRLNMTGQTHESKPLFQRLTQTIVPTHYDLTVQPHLDKFKFNGDVNIHLKVCSLYIFFIWIVISDI